MPDRTTIHVDVPRDIYKEAEENAEGGYFDTEDYLFDLIELEFSPQD